MKACYLVVVDDERKTTDVHVDYDVHLPSSPKILDDILLRALEKRLHRTPEPGMAELCENFVLGR